RQTPFRSKFLRSKLLPPETRWVWLDNRARPAPCQAASPAPAVLPDLLADQARHARFFLGNPNNAALRSPARDLHQQLGADRLLDLVAILDRDDERAGPADHAVLVIIIEIVD